MRWPYVEKPRQHWRNTFAFWPTKVGEHWVWLERYQISWAGDFYERRLMP